MLHFVDDDEAGETAEGRAPLVQPGQTDRIFEVEVVGRVGGHELPRQGGLAALPRPDDGDDRGAFDRPGYQALRRAGDQAACLHVPDNTHPMLYFSWIQGEIRGRASSRPTRA